jgi:hypothetical protein
VLYPHLSHKIQPVAKPKPPPRTPPPGIVGPTPISCLLAAGMRTPQVHQAGIWEAYDPATGRPLFVDGPYGSSSAAAQAAQNLSIIEQSTSGGVYRVTAPVTGHMTAQVDAVAACLSSTANRSGNTF